MMLVTFVRTADELLLDCCKSWENWARKWLTRCQERELVSDTEPLSVATSSSPLSLTAKEVTGLAEEPGRLQKMGAAARGFAKPGAAQRACQVLEGFAA